MKFQISIQHLKEEIKNTVDAQFWMSEKRFRLEIEVIFTNEETI